MLEYIKNKEKYLIKHLEKDEILFIENSICESIGIVIKGQLIIKSYDENGKELIYNIINYDEMFGNNLIFSNDKRYKGNVIASTESEVLLLNKEELLFLLKNNDNFLNSYLEKQADITKNLNTKIKLLSFDLAYDKFMYYLKINNDEITFNSLSALAVELNIQRETISRLVNKLIKENIIIKTNNTIKKIKGH